MRAVAERGAESKDLVRPVATGSAGQALQWAQPQESSHGASAAWQVGPTEDRKAQRLIFISESAKREPGSLNT